MFLKSVDSPQGVVCPFQKLFLCGEKKFLRRHKMSRHYSDPTANAAIGRVDKEMKKMKEYAKLLETMKKEGRLSPEQEREARKLFNGIYKSYF